jgi:hypothetical protein
MSQPLCEPLLEKIQQLTHDLGVLDDQIQALGVEGMNQLHPMGYFALQPQVDRLLKKKQPLLDAWNSAMNELAICKSGQPSQDHA